MNMPCSELVPAVCAVAVCMRRFVLTVILMKCHCKWPAGTGLFTGS